MKLHLPSGLRKALLACLAAVALPAATIPTTIASASGIAAVFLIASQRANAEEPSWPDTDGWATDDTLNEGKKEAAYSTDTVITLPAIKFADNTSQGYTLSGNDSTSIKIEGGSWETSKGGLRLKLSNFDGVWLTGPARFSFEGDNDDGAAFNNIKDLYVNGAAQAFFRVTQATNISTNFHLGGSSISDEVLGTAVNAALAYQVDITTTGYLELIEDAKIASEKGTFTIKGEVKGANKTLDFSKIANIWTDNGGTLALEGGGVLGKLNSTEKTVVKLGGSNKTYTLGGGDMQGKLEFADNASLTLAASANFSVTELSGAIGTLTLEEGASWDIGGNTLTANTVVLNRTATLKLAEDGQLTFSDFSGSGSLVIDLSGIEFSSLEGLQLFTSTAEWYNDWHEKISFTGVAGKWKLQENGQLTTALSTLTWSGTKDTWGEEESFTGGTWENGSSVVFGADAVQKTVNITSSVITDDMQVTGGDYSFKGSDDHTLEVEGTLSLADSTTTTFEVATTVKESLQGGSSAAANVVLGKDMHVQGALTGQLNFSKSEETEADTVWLTVDVDASNSDAFTWLKTGTLGEGVGLGISVANADTIIFKGAYDASEDHNKKFLIDGNLFSATDLKIDSGTVQFDGQAYTIQSLTGESGAKVIIATADASNNKWVTLTNGGNLKGTMGISEWGGQVSLGGDLEIGGLERGNISVGRAGQFKSSSSEKKNLIINNSSNYSVAGLWLGTSVNDAVNLVKRGSGTQTLTGYAVDGDNYTSVYNRTHLWGNVTIEAGLLELTGAETTIEGDVTVEQANLNESFVVTKGLLINAATTIKGKLDVEGNWALYNGLTLSKGGKISGTFHVAWANSSLTLGGDLEVGDLHRGTAQNKPAGQVRHISRTGEQNVYILFSEAAGSNVSNLNSMYDAFAPKGSEQVGDGVGYGIAGKGEESNVTLSLANKAETGYDFKIREAKVTLDGGTEKSFTIGTKGIEGVEGTLKMLELVDSTLVLGDHTLTAGTLSVGGTTGSTISLNMGEHAEGVLTLTGLEFDEGGSVETLTIQLTDYTFGDAHDSFLLFGGDDLSWLADKTGMFTFVDQSGKTITNVTLNADGTLTWTEIEQGLFWGKGGGEHTTLTLGTGGNQWSEEAGKSGEGEWEQSKNVYLEAESGAVEVTVAENATMANLTIREGATYNFSGSQPLEVTGSLTLNTDVNFKSGLTVSAKQLVVNAGDITFENGLTLSNGTEATGITLNGGSITFSGGTVNMGDGDITNTQGIDIVSGTVTIGSGVTATNLGFVRLGNGGTLVLEVLPGTVHPVYGVSLGDGQGYSGKLVYKGLSGELACGFLPGATYRLGELELDGSTLQFNGTSTSNYGNLQKVLAITLKNNSKLTLHCQNTPFVSEQLINVESGSSIEISGSSSTDTAYAVFANGQDVHLAGSGRGGAGALIFSATNTHSANTWVDLFLDADATVSVTGDNLKFYSLLSSADNTTRTFTKKGTSSLIFAGKNTSGNYQGNFGEHVAFDIQEGTIVLSTNSGADATQSYTLTEKLSSAEGASLELDATAIEKNAGKTVTLDLSGDTSQFKGTLAVKTRATLNLSSTNFAGTLDLKTDGTVVLKENTKIAAMKGTGGTLEIAGGKAVTVSSIKDSLSLHTLKLGEQAQAGQLTLTDGSITITDGMSWESGSSITLSAKGQQILLGERLSFTGASKNNQLAIQFGTSYLEGVERGSFQIFGEHWNKDWHDYFKFVVSDDTEDKYQGITIDDNGYLTWTGPEPGENLYWGKGEGDLTKLTLGDGGGAWSNESGKAGDVMWAANKNVHLEAESGSIAVTVGEHATMNNLTVAASAQDSPAYTFSGGKSVTVTGNMSVGERTTLTLSAATLTVDGNLEIASGAKVFVSGSNSFGSLSGAGTLSSFACTVSLGSDSSIGTLDVSWGAKIELGGDLTVKAMAFNNNSKGITFSKKQGTTRDVFLVLNSNDKEMFTNGAYGDDTKLVLNWHDSDSEFSKGHFTFDGVGLKKKGTNIITLDSSDIGAEKDVPTSGWWSIQALVVDEGGLILKHGATLAAQLEVNGTSSLDVDGSTYDVTVGGTATSASDAKVNVKAGSLVLNGKATLSGTTELSGGSMTVAGENSTISNLVVTGGSLTINANTEISQITGSGSLTTLTLGADANLTVGSGKLKGTTIDASEGGGSLTLTMTAEGENLDFTELTLGVDGKLSITLEGYDTWHNAGQTTYQLFSQTDFETLWEKLGASASGKTWKDFFDIEVESSDSLLEWNLDEQGMLTFSEIEGSIWTGEGNGTWSAGGDWKEGEEPADDTPVVFTDKAEKKNVVLDGPIQSGDVKVKSGAYTFQGDGVGDDSLTSSGKLEVSEGASLDMQVKGSFAGGIVLGGDLKLNADVTVGDEGKIEFNGGQLALGDDVTSANDWNDKVDAKNSSGPLRVDVGTNNLSWGENGNSATGGVELGLTNGMEKDGAGEFDLAWSDTDGEHGGGITVKDGVLGLNVGGSATLSGKVTGDGTLKVADGEVTLSNEGNDVKNIEVAGGATLKGSANGALGTADTTITLQEGSTLAGADGAAVTGTVDVKGSASMGGKMSIDGVLKAEGTDTVLTAKEGADLTISGGLTEYKGSLSTETDSQWTLSGGDSEIATNMGGEGSYHFASEKETTMSGVVSDSASVVKDGTGKLVLTGKNGTTGALGATEAGSRIELGALGQQAQWAGTTAQGAGDIYLRNVTLTGEKGFTTKGTGKIYVDTAAAGSAARAATPQGGIVNVNGMEAEKLDGIMINEYGKLTGLTGTYETSSDKKLTLTFTESNLNTAGGEDYLIESEGATITINSADGVTLNFSNSAFFRALKDAINGGKETRLHVLENGTLHFGETFDASELMYAGQGAAQMLQMLGLAKDGVKADGGDIVLQGELRLDDVYFVTKGGDATEANVADLADKRAVLVDEGQNLDVTVTGEDGVLHNLVGGEGSGLTLHADASGKVALNNTYDPVNDERLTPGQKEKAAGMDTLFEGSITSTNVDVEKTGAGTLTVGGDYKVENNTTTITDGALVLNGDTNTLKDVVFNQADDATGEEKREFAVGGRQTTVGSINDDDVTGGENKVEVSSGGNLTLTGKSGLGNTEITGDGSGSVTLDGGGASLELNGTGATVDENGKITGAQLSGVDVNLTNGGKLTVGDEAGMDAGVVTVDGELDVGSGAANHVDALAGSGTLKSADGGALTVGGGSFSGTLGMSDTASSAGTLAVADGASFTLDNAKSDDGAEWDVKVGDDSELTIDVSEMEDGSKLTLGNVDLGNGKTTVNYGEKGYSSDVVSGTIIGAQGSNGTIDFHSDSVMSEGQSLTTNFTVGDVKGDKQQFARDHVTFSGLDGFLNDHNITVDEDGKITVGATAAKENPFERTLPNMEKNSHAGAVMVWDSIKDKRDTLNLFFNALLNPKSDYARMIFGLVEMLDNNEKEGLEKALASIAGSSISTLGPALSEDLHRQLTTIRNRTTTMANELRYDGYDEFPLVHAWINGEGAYRKLDADGFAPGYTVNSWGGTVGMDMDVAAGTTIGLALTAMYGDLKTDSADMGKGDMDTAYVSAFARTSSGPWTHTFIVSGGLADIKLNRTVNYGSGSYTTKGDTDGYAVGALYEIGYTKLMNEAGTLAMQPVINVEVRHAAVKGYKEKGSDAGLQVDDIDQTTVTLGVGARMQAALGANAWNRYSIFEGRVLLKTDLGDRSGTANNAIIGSKNFAEVESAEVGAVGIEIGAGLSIPLGADLGTFFLDGSVEWRTGQTSFDATAGYRISF